MTAPSRIFSASQTRVNARLSALGPRHRAGGIVSPVAIEPVHAPLHAPADAEPAAGLIDRVADLVARAVRDACDPGAEAPRDRLRGPWAECELADAVNAQDVQ